MRREAQLVVPGLYLGPFQASLNAAKMQGMGITHVSVPTFDTTIGMEPG